MTKLIVQRIEKLEQELSDIGVGNPHSMHRFMALLKEGKVLCRDGVVRTQQEFLEYLPPEKREPLLWALADPGDMTGKVFLADGSVVTTEDYLKTYPPYLLEMIEALKKQEEERIKTSPAVQGILADLKKQGVGTIETDQESPHDTDN